MLSTICSAALVGIKAKQIDVEVDLSNGFPCFSIVGLGDAAVHEARDRVRSAIRNSGYEFPSTRRLTVNLAPAYIKKEGACYDLPIAIGVLAATGQIPTSVLRSTLFLGELSLDGGVRPVSGAVPAGLMAQMRGVKRMFVAKENAAELATVAGIRVVPVGSLHQVVDVLRGEQSPPQITKSISDPATNDTNFDVIKGHVNAKRALMIAAVGRHHVFLSGPPGIGKSMLARALPSILSGLSQAERLSVMAIYSAIGRTDEIGKARPFRSPHHSASVAALLGGGQKLQPGELTLAHCGVLFLDELPEFPRNVLEALRQPLEEKRIRLARASQKCTFPADVQLIAAANPCPCGWFGSEEKACSCPLHTIASYQKKISGPLIDRFDISLHLDRPKEEKTHTSDVMKQAVREALEFQASRKQVLTNAETSAAEIEQECKPAARSLLREAYHAYQLTARGYEKTARLARSIADLDLSERITVDHIAEALSFRIIE